MLMTLQSEEPVSHLKGEETSATPDDIAIPQMTDSPVQLQHNVQTRVNCKFWVAGWMLLFEHLSHNLCAVTNCAKSQLCCAVISS